PARAHVLTPVHRGGVALRLGARVRAVSARVAVRPPAGRRPRGGPRRARDRPRHSARRMTTGPAAPLDEVSAAIVAGVARALPGWVEARVRFIADAWGRLDPDVRAAVDDGARQAGV